MLGVFQEHIQATGSAVFLHTFFCPVATTTSVLLSELWLSELDFDDVEDVPSLEMVVDELSVWDPSDSSD